MNETDNTAKTHETLFPFQIEGATYLAQKKTALLADEMGLGKSAQAIVAADNIKAKRILVLCPAIARQNWLREFIKFSTFPRDFDLIFTKSHIPNRNKSAIVSYDLASNFNPVDFGHFDLLILDEAHYLKSTETKRTIAVYGKKGYIRNAKRTWALTGTPAPNHAGELWPLLFTFGCTPLKYDQFVEKYCDTIPSPHAPGKRVVVGTKRESIAELKEILGKIMLRRKTSDVLKDLPEIHFTDLVVEAGEVDISISENFVQYTFNKNGMEELFTLLEKERKLISDIADKVRLGRDGLEVLKGLAKSISSLRMYTGLQKIDPIAELVKEELALGAYEKIVIFAVHREVINNLRVKLRDFDPVTLYGGTPPEKRQKNVDRFQKNKKCRVFIGNIQAAGTAITLTAANQVLFAELDWVPGNNAQAAKRCHRIGQDKPVFVRCVGLADSYDERLSQILKRKTIELTELFEKNSLTAFSTI